MIIMTKALINCLFSITLMHKHQVNVNKIYFVEYFLKEKLLPMSWKELITRINNEYKKSCEL
jgi:hypothetical protein